MCQNLKELTPVELSEVWETEPQHFTPWLAKEENLTLLGKTLGMELEPGGTVDKRWWLPSGTFFARIRLMPRGC